MNTQIVSNVLHVSGAADGNLDDANSVLLFESAAEAAAFNGYASDESKLDGGPLRALARPASTAEVSRAVVRFAAAGAPITVSGARTGIVGGAVAPVRAAVISLERMKTIGELRVDAGIDPPQANSSATIAVQAGVTLQELSDLLDAKYSDWVFPVDPTERSASFGGMISTNAGGARSYRYGSMRNWVKALTVVLADGSILKCSRGDCRVVNGELILAAQDGSQKKLAGLTPLAKPPTKNALGYLWQEGADAIDLFVGAEGTLGIVTEAEVFLERRLENCLYVLSFFENEADALAYVAALDQEQSLAPLAIEFCDSQSLRFVESSPNAKNLKIAAQLRPELKASVYAEVPFDPEQLEQTVETIHSLFLGCGGIEGQELAGFEERDMRDMKAFRHAVPETVNGIIAKRKSEIPGLHKIATDMAVPKASRQAIFEFYREQLDAAGFQYAIFGHAGDAHFHVNILPRTVEELARAKDLYQVFARKVVELGGAVSSEHGLGKLKRPFLAIQYTDEQLATMRKIKEFFDPTHLLNPGVLC